MDPYVARIVKLLDQNKALAALLAPLAVALLTTAANWIITGEFSTNELRIAIGGAILAGVAGLSAYVTPTKRALVDAIPPPVEERARVVVEGERHP
jgi:hypothetical protein